MSDITNAELQAFRDLEQAGWHEGAPEYVTLIGMFTQQTIDASPFRAAFTHLDRHSPRLTILKTQ